MKEFLYVPSGILFRFLRVSDGVIDIFPTMAAEDFLMNQALDIFTFDELLNHICNYHFVSQLYQAADVPMWDTPLDKSLFELIEVDDVC